jgi:protein phosphatase 1G
MGAYLSSPNCEKNTTTGSSQSPVNGTTLEWSATDMQGWRKSMEDAHITKTDLGDGNMCFAVFDGHGGSGVARFCEKHMVDVLREQEVYKGGDIGKALKETFHGLDDMIDSSEYREEIGRLGAEKVRKGRGGWDGKRGGMGNERVLQSHRLTHTHTHTHTHIHSHHVEGAGR